MTHVVDRFEPVPANQQIYNDLYLGVYKKMYQNLKPSYKAIKAIIGL